MTATCYGYLRLSTQDQADNGKMLELYRSQVFARFEQQFKAEFKWGGCIEDLAVSGAKPFDQRPAGLVLWRQLQPGDAVIFPKLDRAFRSLQDAIRVMQHWEKVGVRAIFLDFNCEYGTDAGRYIFHVLAAGAQFERDRLRTRTKEALTGLKLKGRILGRPPWGLRYTGKGENKKMELIPEEYRIGQWVVQQRMAGCTKEAIAAHLNRNSVAKPTRGRRRGVVASMGRWSATCIFRIYHSTLRVMALVERGKVIVPAGS